MKQHVLRLLLPLVAMGLAVLGAGVAAAQSQKPVRFVYSVQAHQAHMMVLPKYAEKYGVKLEMVAMRRYADQQLALTTNQVDFAVLGYVNVGLMEEAGFDNYKVVAGVFTGAQALTLHKDVKASAWKDLEGLRIGTSPNSYSELLFKATAKANGADLSKIKTVSFTAPGPPMLAALKAREIDGFVSWEPNCAEAAVGRYGYYSTLDIAANATKGVNGVLTVNAKYAQQNPDVVVAVLKAVVDATEALNANPAEAAEIAQRGTGAAMPVIQQAMTRGVLDYRIYQKEGEALLELIHEVGITKKATAPALAEHIDYGYLMKATGKTRADLGGR